MTTVINTPPNIDRTDGGDWAISAIILIVIIGIGAFFLINYLNTPTTETANSTDDTPTTINVTLPSTDNEAQESTN